MSPSLHDLFPWTSGPIIINAPMGGFAGGELATAVTQAGGIGFIGGVVDMDALRGHLEHARKAFQPQSPSPANNNNNKTAPSNPGETLLPIGIGLLPFITPLPLCLPLIKTYKPSSVWLFAAKTPSDYSDWTQSIRTASPSTKIWIQTGSITSALSLALSPHPPDILVLQGHDAGGHGHQHASASIISLLPEATDTFTAHNLSHIPLVASGGIVDGRGVAAALSLGAHAVVMGTRFLAAPETVVPHANYRHAVIAATDGGRSTVRAKVFDELRGPNLWPEEYDGRALSGNRSYRDFLGGKIGIERIRELHREAEGRENKGFGAGDESGTDEVSDNDIAVSSGMASGRAAIWAGTGVGLVKEVKPAREIVEEVRREAREALERARARL